jgi:transposase
MNRIVVGVDIAKRVFQLHWVEPQTGEIVALQLKRERFLEHFANRSSCLIGMEACGGSQHWARSLQKLGHEVKLLSGRMVKPFVGGNKNDAADARAIWTAVQQPGIRAVAVKSEEQQAVLALHRMRAQLVKFRTAQSNCLRGLLTEYGEVMPQGRAGVKRDIPGALGRLSDRLPAMVIETLREQYARLGEIDEQISQIERRLRLWQRENPASLRIAAIPGVGLLSATAAVATMGDARVFKSGREFAAWLGLVPRQTGTGGRVRLLGISKRGDTYLRTLLIHGARAILRHSKSTPEWFSELVKRRPKNVAIVAMANKMARTIWALMAHERTYQSGYMTRSAQGCAAA